MSYSQGRLTSLSAIPSDTLYPNFGYEQQIDHDNAGNTTLSHTQRSEGTGGTEQVFLSSRSYYDAAGRLRVTNTHDGVSAATGPGGVWEEYRYDALGRRVLVRSRRLAGTVPQPGGAGNPWSYTERTLWDGDRIVAELRGDGSGGATVGDIESPGTGGIVQNGDAPWGRVQYIHALGSAASGGIDMPVQIERSSVYDDDVLRFSPLVNWRGQVQGAAEAPGSGDVPSIWPAARLTLDGLPAETDPNYFWMGSLANGMTDGSGLQYRRNRYYDPETGRFTQSDPIGIAGGMNLYGFAGGDPLNHRDPFGLCPKPNDTTNSICISLFISAADVGGFKGDGRGPMVESDPSQSRMFVHLDLANNQNGAWASETCTSGGDCRGPSSANRVTRTPGEGGSFTVTLQGRNPFVPKVAGSLMDINATLTFTPDGNGSFSVSGRRDGFPSMEVYHWQNGQARQLIQPQKEQTPASLLPPMEHRIKP